MAVGSDDHFTVSPTWRSTTCYLRDWKALWTYLPMDTDRRRVSLYATMSSHERERERERREKVLPYLKRFVLIPAVSASIASGVLCVL